MDFEAFRKSPGPDLDMMGHWGLHGSILIHVGSLQGQIWRCWGTWASRSIVELPVPALDRMVIWASSQGKARQDEAKQGMAWRGVARFGMARATQSMTM